MPTLLDSADKKHLYHNMDGVPHSKGRNEHIL